MNLAYLAHVLRANRLRLLLVAVALVIWGALLPIIYDAFGQQFRSIIESGIIPPQFTQFGGGDIFSLTGSVALGAIHPFAVALNLVFALGFAGAAIAGERQRGTLEVLLARPISRRVLYLTAAFATALFICVTVGAQTLGTFAGALSALSIFSPAFSPQGSAARAARRRSRCTRCEVGSPLASPCAATSARSEPMSWRMSTTSSRRVPTSSRRVLTSSRRVLTSSRRVLTSSRRPPTSCWRPLMLDWIRSRMWITRSLGSVAMISR